MPSRSPIRAHYNASTVVFYSDVKLYREFVTSIERYCDIALTNHNDAVITVNTVRLRARLVGSSSKLIVKTLEF